jgi:hypothetical protein
MGAHPPGGTHKTPAWSQAGVGGLLILEDQAFSSSVSAKLFVLMPPSEPL